jgi:mRNA interferase YafQ
MRTIERTSQFKRDYKREAKGSNRATLETNFIAAILALAKAQPLPPR